MKNRLQILKILLIVSSSLLINEVAIGTTDKSIDNSESAIKVAEQLTGLIPSLIDNISLSTAVKTEFINLIDTVTPFLGNLGKGQKVWVIRISNLSEFGITNQQINESATADIYIDSATGTMLKTVISIEPLIPELDIELSASYCESYLTKSNQIYSGYPPSNQNLLSLVEAIFKCPILPSNSRQTVAQLVLFKWGDRQPVPAWVLTLRGIEPRPTLGPGGSKVPVYQRNKIRYVIDASSGNLLFGTNTPPVQLKNADRNKLFPPKLIDSIKNTK